MEHRILDVLDYRLLRAAAYLDGDISLARAAALLGLTRFDLMERFDRLGLPILAGPATVAEARSELDTLR